MKHILLFLSIGLIISCQKPVSEKVKDTSITQKIDSYQSYLEAFLALNNFYQQDEPLSTGLKNFLLRINTREQLNWKYPNQEQYCLNLQEESLFLQIWTLDTVEIQTGSLFELEENKGKVFTQVDKNFNLGGEYYQHLEAKKLDLQPVLYDWLNYRKNFYPGWGFSLLQRTLDNRSIFTIDFEDPELVRMIIVEWMLEILYYECNE